MSDLMRPGSALAMPADGAYDIPPQACPRCVARGKTWKGSEPICAFPAGGAFSTENWNCATMNELRDRAENNAVYNEDSYAAVIACGEGDGWIILEWYKRRGRTEAAYWLDGFGKIAPLTLAIATAAVEEIA